MRTFLIGTAIGIANIIPGVSGGTLALILGIYERLITAIKRFDLELLRLALRVLSLRRSALAAFVNAVRERDLPFLVQIGLGALTAIVLASSVMKRMLDSWFEASYSFFFGLVLVSMYFPYAYLKRRGWREALAFVVAAAFAVAIVTGLSDEEALRAAQEKLSANIARGETAAEAAAWLSFAVPPLRESLMWVWAAALAISAMILPGISGSFVLLLIGMYFETLQAINERQVVPLALFAAGMVFGLVVFSRLMAWLLMRFYNATMAFMLGLMAGSLWGLWPFKRIEIISVGETSEKVVLGNLWPSAFDSRAAGAVLALLAGMALVFVFILFERRGLKPGAAAETGD